jgi:hypothetical protein
MSDARVARTILLLAEGETYSRVAELVGCSPTMVGLWKGGDRLATERTTLDLDDCPAALRVHGEQVDAAAPDLDLPADDSQAVADEAGFLRYQILEQRFELEFAFGEPCEGIVGDPPEANLVHVGGLLEAHR